MMIPLAKVASKHHGPSPRKHGVLLAPLLPCHCRYSTAGFRRMTTTMYRRQPVVPSSICAGCVPREPSRPFRHDEMMMMMMQVLFVDCCCCCSCCGGRRTQGFLLCVDVGQHRFFVTRENFLVHVLNTCHSLPGSDATGNDCYRRHHRGHLWECGCCA